jgi:signal transduction histidine kinase
VTVQTVNNVVLLVLAGLVVGYGLELVRAGRAELAAAVAVRAANQERERLARDIHDSVLQVLGYVQRRGADLDGEAAELALLAGEQEARLRALVATGPVEVGTSGEADLRAALAAYARSGVTVSGPGEPVLLPAAAVSEIAAATGAALDNVERHAGPDAKAWVLVEDEGDAVTVTVRDDGVGIPAGRLAAAAREGRLGVASSICARIRQLGGTASVDAVGEGTEVEMRVPR